MKPYGHKRGEQGCCPGHDPFPWPGERTRNRKQKNRSAKRRERGKVREMLKKELDDDGA